MRSFIATRPARLIVGWHQLIGVPRNLIGDLGAPTHLAMVSAGADNAPCATVRLEVRANTETGAR